MDINLGLFIFLILNLAVAKKREDPTISNTLHRVVGTIIDSDAGTINDNFTGEKQKLKIINVGLARTGTSSFVTAMQDLGIKSYHMKDGVQDTPGHLDLWINHASLAFTNKDKIKNNWREELEMIYSRKDLFERISVDGFNATADMPMNVYYRELAELYPDALIVLTLHHTDDSNRWANSVLATIGQNPVLFRKRPWCWIPVISGILRMEEWAWYGLGLPVNTESYVFNHSDLSKLYTKWNSEVESWFNSQNRKILKFKATEGWEPLCKYITKLGDIAINKKCEKMVSSNLPFPRANMDLRYVYKILNIITEIFKYPLFFIVLFPVLIISISYKFCLYIYRRYRVVKSKKQD